MFASDIVKLHIGPDLVELTAHKAALISIGFFAKCLGNPLFVEAKSNEIALPDDDPNAWEEIIHFAYTRKVRPQVRNINIQDVDDNLVNHLLITFIHGDKYCMEKFSNHIIDALTFCYGLGYVEISGIALVYDHGLQQSELARFMIEELAVSIRRFGWKNFIRTQYNSLEADLKAHPAIAVLARPDLNMPKRVQGPGEPNWTCQYHTHIMTSACY